LSNFYLQEKLLLLLIIKSFYPLIHKVYLECAISWSSFISLPLLSPLRAIFYPHQNLF
jgi:hypothetical protein